MTGDILLNIAGRLLGFPQAPDCPLPRPVEHAFRRGFALPAVASSCTSAQERGAAQCAVQNRHSQRENMKGRTVDSAEKNSAVPFGMGRHLCVTVPVFAVLFPVSAQAVPSLRFYPRCGAQSGR